MRIMISFLLTVGPLLAVQENPPPANRLIIHNVTVVSPGQNPIPNAFVVIHDETIEQVGQGTPPDSTHRYRSLDGKGHFLIPGLVDTHVHLAFVPGMIKTHEDKNPAMVAAYRRQLPRSYLYFGFTTLIDLNAVNREILRAFKEEPHRPDLHDCDCALPIANGYPMVYIPKPFRFQVYRNFIYDSNQKEQIPAWIEPENHSPQAAVARVKKAGGICVKTYYEPGFGNLSNLPLPDEDLLTQVRQETRQQNLTLTMHANSLQAHQFAAEVGVDVIVHGMWRQPGNGPGLEEAVKTVLDEIRKKNIGYSPTFQVMGGLVSLFDNNYLQDPLLAEVLPAELLAWYRSEAGQWFKRAKADEFGNASQAKIRDLFQATFERGKLAARYLAAQNSTIVFGSDTPSGPLFTNPPGYNGYLEIQSLAEIGISLNRLLGILTVESARAFGLEDQIGTVASGKKANLLLLRTNPLESSKAYGDIDRVILRGEVISRNKLSAKAVTPGK